MFWDSWERSQLKRKNGKIFKEFDVWSLVRSRSTGKAGLTVEYDVVQFYRRVDIVKGKRFVNKISFPTGKRDREKDMIAQTFAWKGGVDIDNNNLPAKLHGNGKSTRHFYCPTRGKGAGGQLLLPIGSSGPKTYLLSVSTHETFNLGGCRLVLGNVIIYLNVYRGWFSVH